MRKQFIILFFLLPIVMIGQKEDRLKMMQEKNNAEALAYYKKVIGEDKEALTITDVPEEWKDESVVILKQQIYLSFFGLPKLSFKTEKRGTVPYKGITRKSILIQDNSGLKEFSEFYFQSSDIIGIDIKKKNGSEINIDLNSAVSFEKDVPSFYKDTYHKETYFKIAIPNLELGDIIKYYKVYTDRTAEKLKFISSLASKYPVLESKYIIDYHDKWEFNYKLINTKVSVTELEGGFDGEGTWQEKFGRIEFKTRLAPYDEERWENTLLTVPTIKIAATLAKVFDRNTMDHKSLIKKKLLQIGYVLIESKRLKYLDVQNKPLKEQAELLYRLVRRGHLNAYYTLEPHEYYEMDDGVFIKSYSRALNKYNIEHKIVAMTPRTIGEIENVLLPDEIGYAVYITKLDQYYFPINNYNVGGEINSEYFEANGYITTKKEIKNNEDIELSGHQMPTSNFKDHTNINELSIKLDKQDSLSFLNTITFTGGYKQNYSHLLLSRSKYHFNQTYSLSYEKTKNKLDKSNNNSKLNKDPEYLEFEKEKNKHIDEVIQKWLKTDFNFEKLNSFEITSFGITRKKPELKFKSSFKSGKYIKKAGPNLIFEVGSLIQPQVQLTEKEINHRTKEVQLDFAKTITNNITIELPKGTKVEGLDALNTNVDNQEGSFKSSAELNDNILSIQTSKIYKHQTVAPENWQDLVEMLEAAYNFSQKKIILKKK